MTGWVVFFVCVAVAALAVAAWLDGYAEGMADGTRRRRSGAGGTWAILRRFAATAPRQRANSRVLPQTRHTIVLVVTHGHLQPIRIGVLPLLDYATSERRGRQADDVQGI